MSPLKPKIRVRNISGGYQSLDVSKADINEAETSMMSY